jgi:hypothetical protein
MLRKSSENTKLFCKYPPHIPQTARAESQPHKICPLVSGSKPHIGHKKSGNIFRLKRLDLVGRISLQALQINKLIDLGTFKLQILFHRDKEEESVEELPRFRVLRSTSRWYALRTENIPDLVLAHII